MSPGLLIPSITASTKGINGYKLPKQEGSTGWVIFIHPAHCFGLFLSNLRSRHSCTASDSLAKQHYKSDAIGGTFIARETTKVFIQVHSEEMNPFPPDPGRGHFGGFDFSYRTRQSGTTNGKYRISDCIKTSNMAVWYFFCYGNVAERKQHQPEK